MSCQARFLLTIAIIFISIAPACGQESPSLDPHNSWMTHNYLAEMDSTSPDIATLKAIPGKKSMPKAALMSAIAPGLGEFYAGTKTGLIQTVTEIGLWAGFFHYNNKAADKRDEYEAYADVHWDFERWDEWYNSNSSGWADSGSETFERNGDVPVKDHHYYEKLGKYAWAQGGWDDFLDEYQENQLVVQYSDNHHDYLYMRKDKNNFNSRATWSVNIAIVNHLVSAFRAGLLARSFNNKLTDLSGGAKLEFAAAGQMSNPEYWVTLTKSF